MDLDLSDDQSMLLGAIAPLIARHRHLEQPASPDYFVYGHDLDSDLESAGYYGDGGNFSIDATDASLVLEHVMQCPASVPAMASLIVAPAIPMVLPRPLALVPRINPDLPVRFLAESRTAIVDAGDAILAVDLADAHIEPVDTIFAYPFARLVDFDRDKAQRIEGITPEQLRDRWRLGLIFEILGALRAAHGLTVDYVKQREQFKRQIGSFQAVQHRLSEGAVHIHAIHYMGVRAAMSGDPAEIALAASYAQKHIAQTIFDCHQFHGAMGLTLEYVLHHWTYKLKILAGELDGSSAQARYATSQIWGAAA